MMARHSEVMAALDDIGAGSLSTVDYAYYTEAMARITTKLAEVGQWWHARRRYCSRLELNKLAHSSAECASFR